MVLAQAALMGMVVAASGRDLPLVATLQDSAGRPRSIAEYRGKPVVLFYEDKDAQAINQELKTQLFLRARERHLLDAAWVVPVANLAGYDWFPAKRFATAAVRDAEGKAGVPVLIDWGGALSAPPWSLPSNGSSVLLLDAEGKLVFGHSGKLSAADLEALFGALDLLLVPRIVREP